MAEKKRFVLVIEFDDIRKLPEQTATVIGEAVKLYNNFEQTAPDHGLEANCMGPHFDFQFFEGKGDVTSIGEVIDWAKQK